MDATGLSPGARTVWELFDVGWNQRDASIFERNCSEDCRFHFRGESLPMPSPQGRAILREWLEAFPDFRFELLDVIEQENRIALRMSFKGTHERTFYGYPATHRAIHVTQMIFVTIEEGRVKELWEDYDEMGMWQQLGRKLGE